MGVSQYYQKNLDAAIKLYKHTIELKPDYPEALSNLGLALNDLNKIDEALICLDRAIALKSDSATAYLNRGIALSNLNRREDALASYDRAIAIKPDFVEAHNNQGAALCDLNRLEEALVAYEHAIRLAPDHELFYGSMVEMKLKLCDWRNYDEHIKHIELQIEAGKNVIHPFTALALSESPALQKRAAENFVREKFPVNNALPPINQYPKHDKIRVAYFSADFRNHAVYFLTAELFERHDKSKFELIAFSLITGPNDEMRKLVERAFDQSIDVSTYSDKEVALMVREMEIDIAIDLGGFTSLCRASIFALRAAPIQINYIGYPGTMGAEYVDYVIADTKLVPHSHQKFYSEKNFLLA